MLKVLPKNFIPSTRIGAIIRYKEFIGKVIQMNETSVVLEVM